MFAEYSAFKQYVNKCIISIMNEIPMIRSKHFFMKTPRFNTHERCIDVIFQALCDSVFMIRTQEKSKDDTTYFILYHQG